MAAYEDIIYDVKDRIATITLNRPDRLNAYTDRMSRNIRVAMAEAVRDSGVRVIMLTGAGRGFCAGADMDVLTNIVGNTREPTTQAHDADDVFDSGYGPSLHSEFMDMRRFGYFMRTKKPIIAAINGPVAGIGLVMALYADMRFVSEKAVLTTSFAQRGLIAEHGISWLLPRLVGPAHALDLLLSARKLTPQEAERIGLVNKVLPQETFMQDVTTYARLLADTVSPRSMAIIKAQVWKAEFQSFGEALAVADIEMAQTFRSPEFKEGVAHYLEKRAAQFADI